VTGQDAMLGLWLASVIAIVMAVVVDRAWSAGYRKGKADAMASVRRSGLLACGASWPRDSVRDRPLPRPPPNTASAKGEVPDR
jgi:hypothetical protein